MFSYFYYGYIIYRVYEYSSLINTACRTCNHVYGTYKWLRSDQRKFDLITDTNDTESDWDLCENSSDDEDNKDNEIKVQIKDENNYYAIEIKDKID